MHMIHTVNSTPLTEFDKRLVVLQKILGLNKKPMKLHKPISFVSVTIKLHF